MIYPLTICFDRYNGVYSGGLYTAWNCDPENVPTEISDDDVTCADFWRDVRNHHYTFLPTFGVGSTVDEAIENLRKKILGAEEDHDKETRTSDIFCEGNLDMVPVVKVREALGIAEDSDIFECIEYRNRQLETLRDRLVVKRRMYDNAIDERNKFGRRLRDIREASGMADDDRSDLVEYIETLRKSEETYEDLYKQYEKMYSELRDAKFTKLSAERTHYKRCYESLKNGILEVYREIFDCSNGDPEGTDEETMNDILTEYKRVLKLKDVAEEKTIKYKELARENEDKANKYKVRLGNAERQLRWTEEVNKEWLKKYEKLKSELDEMKELYRGAAVGNGGLCEELAKEKERTKRLEQKLSDIQAICER